MATVAQMLDSLAAGRTNITEVAADFRKRSWGPARPPTTEARAWGVQDDEPADADSWAAVESDSRLTAAQYAVLVRARDRAGR